MRTVRGDQLQEPEGRIEANAGQGHGNLSKTGDVKTAAGDDGDDAPSAKSPPIYRGRFALPTARPPEGFRLPSPGEEQQAVDLNGKIDMSLGVSLADHPPYPGQSGYVTSASSSVLLAHTTWSPKAKGRHQLEWLDRDRNSRLISAIHLGK